jgi:ribulose-5-phosphate 4-epimerase/fuculose-1-phosphate aldolase
MEDGNIAVTPSSLDYRIMTPEDIVVVNPAGDVVSGERGPPRRSTSTWPP